MLFIIPRIPAGSYSALCVCPCKNAHRAREMRTPSNARDWLKDVLTVLQCTIFERQTYSIQSTMDTQNSMNARNAYDTIPPPPSPPIQLQQNRKCALRVYASCKRETTKYSKHTQPRDELVGTYLQARQAAVMVFLIGIGIFIQSERVRSVCSATKQRPIRAKKPTEQMTVAIEKLWNISHSCPEQFTEPTAHTIFHISIAHHLSSRVFYCERRAYVLFSSNLFCSAWYATSQLLIIIDFHRFIGIGWHSQSIINYIESVDLLHTNKVCFLGNMHFRIIPKMHCFVWGRKDAFSKFCHFRESNC